MYNSDRAVLSGKEDLLERKNFARQLATTISLFNSIDALTIGLYGKWGGGKTSVINMMLEELKLLEANETKHNIPIVFKFEPWNFYDTNQLLNQFFTQLSNELKNKKSRDLLKIGDALEKYSDAFECANAIPIVGAIVAYTGKKSMSWLGKRIKGNEADISIQKNNVIKLLEKQNRKILVIIDDIDRLNNEQIRQIFQLVTSVAKFPNLVYMLAFDKEVIVKALEQVQGGNGNEYLKKIIQIPIHLPDIRLNNIKNILFDKLNFVIQSLPEVNFDSKHWHDIFEPCILPLITNLRDINQLCNLIQFKLTSISSEVEFSDMVAISALEMRNYAIFNWLKDNKSVLTGDVDWSTFGIHKTPEELKELYRNEIRMIVQNFVSEQEVSKNVDFVINYLTHLFPYFGSKIGVMNQTYDIEQLRVRNRIGHPAKFDRYFHLNADYIGLKSNEIKNVTFFMDYDELVAFLLKKDKENLAYDLLKEMYVNIKHIASNRAGLLAEALFELGYQFENRHDFFQFNIGNYTQLLIRELIDIIDPNDRMLYIKSFLDKASINQLQAFADFFNITELSYGKLAAKGEEKDYKKLVTLQELEELEMIFREKIRCISEKYNILDFSNAKMYIHLFKNLDAEGFEKYIKKALESDENKIKYSCLYVYEWVGAGVSYEIDDNYERNLNSSDIVEAIDRLLHEKKYFEFPLNIQRKGAALYLKVTESERNCDQVSQKEADEILTMWK